MNMNKPSTDWRAATDPDVIRGAAHAGGYEAGLREGQRLERERALEILRRPDLAGALNFVRELIRVGGPADAGLDFIDNMPPGPSCGRR